MNNTKWIKEKIEYCKGEIDDLKKSSKKSHFEMDRDVVSRINELYELKSKLMKRL